MDYKINVMADGNIFENKKEKTLLASFIEKREGVGEELLDVQRQHFIVVFFKFFFLIFLSILVIVALFFEINYRYVLPEWLIPLFSGKFLVGFTLFMLSIFSTLGTYIFMRWYYQFYIITNKRVMHVHFFRLMGFYEEEIFFEKVTTERIDRNAPNILYDFLGIEDVYVYMLSIESAEPFIFKSPQNAQKIENILEKIINPAAKSINMGVRLR